MSDDVFAKVHADLELRNEVGLTTYGRSLRTFDGRDSLQDAYEEALDFAVYMAKVILERDAGEGTCPQCGRTTHLHRTGPALPSLP